MENWKMNKWNSKSTLTPLILIMVVATTLLATASAHADQFLRKPVDDWTYEDRFAFQPGMGTYTVDPWVWAYTAEFAEKLRMPAKWIDKDLKGLLAVTFRMTSIGNMSCGYGDKEDSCWPVQECQLDVYFDNRIKLPWTLDEVKQGFLLPWVSSMDFLTWKPSRPCSTPIWMASCEADAQWNRLRVWQDANGDGVTDAGELKTLAQAGMASLNLTAAKTDWVSGGNRITGFTTWQKTDGTNGWAADVGLG